LLTLIPKYNPNLSFWIQFPGVTTMRDGKYLHRKMLNALLSVYCAKMHDQGDDVAADLRPRRGIPTALKGKALQELLPSSCASPSPSPSGNPPVHFRSQQPEYTFKHINF
jgi:hypothetical protein